MQIEPNSFVTEPRLVIPRISGADLAVLKEQIDKCLNNGLPQEALLLVYINRCQLSLPDFYSLGVTVTIPQTP
jgi:hypothetical protein